MDIWNTLQMGTTIKMAMRMTLGAIQMYGSILRKTFLPERAVVLPAGAAFGAVSLLTGTPP